MQIVLQSKLLDGTVGQTGSLFTWAVNGTATRIVVRANHHVVFMSRVTNRPFTKDLPLPQSSGVEH